MDTVRDIKLLDFGTKELLLASDIEANSGTSNMDMTGAWSFMSALMQRATINLAEQCLYAYLQPTIGPASQSINPRHFGGSLLLSLNERVNFEAQIEGTYQRNGIARVFGINIWTFVVPSLKKIDINLQNLQTIYDYNPEYIESLLETLKAFFCFSFNMNDFNNRNRKGNFNDLEVLLNQLNLLK
jgi:hypothetical protein